MKKYIYVSEQTHQKMHLKAVALGRKLQDVANEACEFWLKNKNKRKGAV